MWIGEAPNSSTAYLMEPCYSRRMKFVAGGLVGALALGAAVGIGAATHPFDASAPQAAPPDATAAPWAKYIGTWRADPKAVAGQPRAPYLLRMTVETGVLVMEWHSMAEQHALRLPIDGTPVAVTDNGHAVDMHLALDGPMLTVTSQRHTPNGSVVRSAVTYAVSRNRLLIDHSSPQLAGAAATGPDVFTKVPTNMLTHGGTGALGPTGRQ